MARAYNQAQKFGVEMAIPDEAIGLRCPPRPGRGAFVAALANDERVRARSVVIASGARYRRLDVANLDEFEGVERALLGVAAGGEALRRAGGRAGRRRQFGGPGGGLPGEPGRQGLAPRARARASAPACRATSSTASRASRTSRWCTQAQVTRPRRPRRRARGRPLARASGEEMRRPIRPPLPLHRRRAEHRLAVRLRRRARRQGFRAHRRAIAGRSPAAGDQPPRRVRHRRRPLGLGQARRRGRRRRRAGGRDAAWLSGETPGSEDRSGT